MRFHLVPENPHFIGRQREWRRMERVSEQPKAKILVFYGRRRVGKTELIEQFFRTSNILKFEGLQPDTPNPRSKRSEFARQLASCLRMFASYKQEDAFSKLRLHSWSEFFELLDPLLKNQKVVLYFEELQWLSCYSSDFLAELKIYWDNRWRHYPELTLIFCGSSPAFIVGEFMSDKALYGRSVSLFHIEPFSLAETAEYLNCGFREALLVQLTVGGVSEYLNQLKLHGSIHQGIVWESFVREGFFLQEIERIFISNMRGHSAYRRIIEKLSEAKYLTRENLVALVEESSGGTFTKILRDLELCGFIEKYTPLHLESRSTLVRYAIRDPYLNFFNKFISPQLSAINRGQFEEAPERALNQLQFQTMLGFNFESWCRRNAQIFARHLGFDRIEYRAGSYFNRRTADKHQGEDSPGFQVDLMFIRADSRVVITEIKYGSTSLGRNTVRELTKKMELFRKTCPKYRNYTYELAIITPELTPEAESLRSEVDYVIALEEMF